MPVKKSKLCFHQTSSVALHVNNAKCNGLSVITILMSLLTLFAIASNTHAQTKAAAPTIEHNQQTNLRFHSLVRTLFSTPYQQRPNYKVNRSLFGSKGDNKDNQLRIAARRTLNDESDLIDLPTRQKLLNANGICFSGQWLITEENMYSGLYKQGTVSPAIVRASVALSGTLQKDKRAFGMAIKLLPDNLDNAASLNVFVLHSMGGTKTSHVLDLSMDNQPPLGRLPRWRDLSTALRLKRELELADKEQGAKKPSAAFRPVTIFADYQTPEGKTISPKWLRLSPSIPTRIDQDDFRDELNVEHYPNKTIIYNIDVAPNSNTGNKKHAQWQHIGELTLTASVTSSACDKQLHFKHPALN